MNTIDNPWEDFSPTLTRNAHDDYDEDPDFQHPLPERCLAMLYHPKRPLTDADTRGHALDRIVSAGMPDAIAAQRRLEDRAAAMGRAAKEAAGGSQAYVAVGEFVRVSASWSDTEVFANGETGADRKRAVRERSEAAYAKLSAPARDLIDRWRAGREELFAFLDSEEGRELARVIRYVTKILDLDQRRSQSAGLKVQRMEESTDAVLDLLDEDGEGDGHTIPDVMAASGKKERWVRIQLDALLKAKKIVRRRQKSPGAGGRAPFAYWRAKGDSGASE